ncbi:hypothetical protein PR048_031208 [Dryococelus australis]|uniref:Uncharacterized protein n=1 Tax=Dryococelus australis TaxID=614101 RepID=A0ABQ9G5R5_9NEOP|nr:hypothetical protein PR048_031208 [Dryococelus australis]
MQQRRNERVRETEDPRENPPSSGIVRHDSHLQMVRLLASHLVEPGSIPGFSHMGIESGDAAGRRVFSEISRFPRPCVPALLHTHLSSPSSAIKTSISFPHDGVKTALNDNPGWSRASAGRGDGREGIGDRVKRAASAIVRTSLPIHPLEPAAPGDMSRPIRPGSSWRVAEGGQSVPATCAQTSAHLSSTHSPCSNWQTLFTIKSLRAECGNWDIGEEDGRRREIMRQRRTRCSWCEWTRGRETGRVKPTVRGGSRRTLEHCGLGDMG